MSEAVSVVELTPALEPAWERFVAASPDAGVYHTLAWKRVTEEGLGHRARYLCAVASQQQVVGALPLFEVRGLFGRRLVSLPMRDRGGVAARDAGVAALLVGAAAALGERTRAAYLELRGREPLAPEVLGERAWSLNRGWVTTRVDLAPGADALWKKLDKDAMRWAIKKADKNGVEIVEDASLEGIRRFHELFVATRTAMGIPPFPRALFDALHRHVIAAGLGELLLARCGGEWVHGLVSLYSKDTFVPAYAAPQRRFAKLYANERILWASMERAVQRGFRWYDFGADSEKQESLLFFKRKWNGVQERMAYHVLPLRGAAPDFDSSGPRYERLRAIWRRFPTPVSRLLGAFVTRQLS